MPDTSARIAAPHAPVSAPSTVEARSLGGTLTRTEWVLNGTGNHIFLLTSGAATVRFGQHGMVLSPPSIIWAPTGVPGAILFEAGAEGAALGVPDTVLGSAMPDGAAFAPVRDAIARPVQGIQPSASVMQIFSHALGAIRQETTAQLPGSQDLVRHHLAIVLISLWRLTTPQTANPRPSSRNIVRSFMHLVELRFRQHWTVAQYATETGVTADKLNTSIRRITGKTPMELVHGRLMAEALSLLDNSSLTIAGIADLLGFTDAAYFSRFFKRMTGISPSLHRSGAARNPSPEQGSYAAWP